MGWRKAVGGLLCLAMLWGCCACQLAVRGDQGERGLPGEQGAPGEKGETGESAYEIACRNGFSGTEQEWLESLQPAPGIRSAAVNEEGHLILTLTDGSTLDAGQVGATGGSGDDDGSGNIGETDAEGFLCVQQTVYATGPVNVRSAPTAEAGASEIIGKLDEKQTLRRTGIHPLLGWSRVIYEGRTAYVSSRYLEVTVPEEVVDIGKSAPVVCLPDSCTVTVGEPFRLYPENFVLGLSDQMYVSFRYSGSNKASCLTEKDVFTLTEQVPGTYLLTVTLSMYLSGTLTPIARKTVEVVAVEPGARDGLVGLVIGDSRISDGTIVSALPVYLGGTLTMLGTKKYAGTFCEGHSGWSTNHYLNYASVGGTTNPFYTPTVRTDSETGVKHHFDFAGYMENFDGAVPDFVVLHLGANDAYTWASVERLKVMVHEIRAYGETKGKDIAVLLMTEYWYPDGGYRLAGSVDVEKSRFSQANHLTYMKQAFSGRENENIYLLPNYLVLNRESDRRLSASEEGETVITDVAHLGYDGYLKETQVILSYLYRIFGAGQ